MTFTGVYSKDYYTVVKYSSHLHYLGFAVRNIRSVISVIK